MMCSDNHPEISRRHFVQSFMAALAALSLPSVAPASPAVHSSLPPFSPAHGAVEAMIDRDIIAGRPVKLIGVGGAGSNTVEYMIAHGLQGVQFICADTDAEALARSAAVNTIQLGMSGLGANSHPDIDRAAASEADAKIRTAIKGTRLLFITAGMGGGTGTGAAPVIARIAKEMGILSVGLVTMPFEWEGDQRLSHAEAGLLELQAYADSVMVLHNDRLLSLLGDEVTQGEAFGCVADHFRSVVFGLAEAINSPNTMGVDFLDALTIMRLPGKTMMGCAAARGPERARIATEQALTCPLADGADLLDAKGALVLVAATKEDLKSSEFRLISNLVRARIAPDAHLVCGVTYDENLNDKVRVTVVAARLPR